MKFHTITKIKPKVSRSRSLKLLKLVGKGNHPRPQTSLTQKSTPNMWYHTNVVWNQADRNYDLRQICHSAFFKDRAKNVKVRHEKVAKNRQKWVQIFFGMSHMLNNDICNIFLFFTFFLLVLSRPCFWAILKKSAQKQGLESTKRKKVKNKKNVANVVI